MSDMVLETLSQGSLSPKGVALYHTQREREREPELDLYALSLD